MTDTLPQDHGLLVSLLQDESVENYIRPLLWSDTLSDDEKTLIAGNIRGFVAWLKKDLAESPSAA